MTAPVRRPPRDRPDLTAPVVTDQGVWGTLPPPYTPPAPQPRPTYTALLAAALAVVVALAIADVGLWLLTARTVAIPAHERALAALAQPDALLDLHADAICAQVAAGDRVSVPGFPVADATLPPDAAPCPGGALDHDAARAALLARGAELVYLRGTDAFAPAGATPADRSPSGDAAIRLLLGELGADWHGRAALLAVPLAAAALVLAATLALRRRRAALAPIGLALALGAAPVALAALAARLLAARADAPTDPLLAEFGDLTAALLGVPLRLSLAALLVGLALFASNRRRSARR